MMNQRTKSMFAGDEFYDDVEQPYPRWMEEDRWGNHPDDDAPYRGDSEEDDSWL